MRIKTNPGDFSVKEVLHFAPGKKETSFRLYILEKRGWNTTDAIKATAEQKNVPVQEIRSLGKKDRHAHTAQYLSAPSKYDLTCEGDGYSVRFAGYSTVHLEPAVLKGNQFSLILRDMNRREADRVETRLEETALRGFANYFDDQRFGNVGNKGEFFAEMLVKRRFGPALRKYFSFHHPDAPLYLKKRKTLVAEKWGRWDELEPFCPEPLLKKMLAVLRSRGENGFRACLKLLPDGEMGMFFSAYSSFLWNETFSRFLAGEEGDFFPVKLRTGPVLQYRTLPDSLFGRLSSEILPTVGPDMPSLAPDMEKVFSRLLSERGVRLSKFRLKEIDQAYFASFPRQCVVFPGGLEWQREEDDLFPGKGALYVRFFLPRGSYATMLLKAVSEGPVSSGRLFSRSGGAREPRT